MARKSLEWNDQQISTLCRMWREGSTAMEIGDRLGVSRHAVLGRVYRLHLTRKPVKPRDLPAYKIPAAKAANVPCREVAPPPRMSRMWSLDDDKRRLAFAKRASKAAKEAREAASL